MLEHIIITHIYFLRGYYRSWWNPHFQWQKHVDSQRKTPGFLGCYMAVHFFAQDRDLKAMKNNWKTNEHFAAFVSEFELADVEYEIDDLADKYFARADAIHTKHFSQWTTNYLHIALAGDNVPARYIANWLLEIPIPSDLPMEYYSEKHDTMINTTFCGRFLVSNNNPSDYQAKEFYTLHRDAIQEIAEGNKMWGEIASEKMIHFRQYVTEKWFIVSSNTQLVERWVKDSNECTISGKDECFSSIIAICRSSTVFEYKLEAKEEAERRVLKGNQYITSGRKGDRINRKTNQLELGTNKLRNIRGSSYSALVIKKTMIRNDELQSNENMEHIRSSIRQKLTSKGDQFRTARIDKSVEKYAHVLPSDAPIPILNAI